MTEVKSFDRKLQIAQCEREKNVSVRYMTGHPPTFDAVVMWKLHKLGSLSICFALRLWLMFPSRDGDFENSNVQLARGRRIPPNQPMAGYLSPVYIQWVRLLCDERHHNTMLMLRTGHTVEFVAGFHYLSCVAFSFVQDIMSRTSHICDL